ncbi:hypothetical protein NECAME_16709 [Necator americanus]|uniref:RNA-directed DNA polymerase n=1 Tax=Necator americanus TaxID=51031 RepID=W2TUZ1_NECAM|nr:hypothetical protein NECAME_16709 [Necator americanus]ETN85643.1 hypothetical protein NECAME_16709 [Necator americanus]
MTMLARGYVYWTNIHRDIEETVRHCRNCQEAAKMPKKTVLIFWTSEKKPLDRIHIDYAGPLNAKIFENSYLSCELGFRGEISRGCFSQEY